MIINKIFKLSLLVILAYTLTGCSGGGTAGKSKDDIVETETETETETEPEVTPNTPVELKPLLFINFNEDSGQPITLNQTDQSIFTITNIFASPERVPGIEGNALRTDGFSTWATGLVELPPLTEMTVEAWVALESYPSDQETTYHNLSPAAFITNMNAGKGFSLNINTFGQWHFNVTIDDVLYTLSAPEIFPLYSWNHIAAVVDGFNGHIKLFLNGTEVASSNTNPVGGEIDKVESDILIGKSHQDLSLGLFPMVNALNGAFDDVKIFQGSKTATDFSGYQQIVDLTHPLGTTALVTPDSRFIDDSLRPIYHAMPPANWANEPHGLVEFNGQYHMFYQRTPNGPFKTQMHWGHMKSPDFVNWTHLKDALWPEVETGGTQGFDMKGIWSGDVVVEDGVAYAFYTSVNHAGAFNPGIAMATSADDDLQNWTKHGPIIDRTGADDMRDPYLWKEGDVWHMIIGAIKAGRGYLLHYSTSDIRNQSSWVKSEFMSTDAFANMGPDNTLWEMPVFEKISDEKYILLVNPVGGGYRPRGLYWIGRWQNGQFVPDNTQAKNLDLIIGHISPTLARNTDGDITAIGIVDERRRSQAQLAAGWTQTFSAPRVWGLAEDNATLTQTAAPELINLRVDGSLRLQTNLTVNGETFLNSQGRHVEIIAQLNPNRTANKYGLVIAESSDGREKTVLYYDVENKNIVLDKTKSSLSADALELTEQIGAYDESVFGKPEKFHVLIDGSVVDVFINDKAAFSFRIYPTLADSQHISLYSQAAETEFIQVEVYQLKDMQALRTYLGVQSDIDGIVEEQENGEQLTISVTQNTLVNNLNMADWTIVNLPEGVSIGNLERLDDTTAQLTLVGNASQDFDADLTDLFLSVSASQFSKNQLPKTVVAQSAIITAEVETVTQAKLSVNNSSDNQIYEGAESGKQLSLTLENNLFANSLNKDNWIAENLPVGLDFSLIRVSATQVNIELFGTAESYTNQDKWIRFAISADEFTNADPELFGQPATTTSVLFVANKIYNVTLPVDGQNSSLVIGRFDGAQTTLTQGWSASGDFANPATESVWQGTTVNSTSAQIGNGAVSTCEMNGNEKGCDHSTGRLTSPIFKLNKSNIYTLLAGGENNNKAVGIRLLDTAGNLLHNYSPASCGVANIDGDEDWAVIQASVLKGANIRAQFYDEATEGCGFVSFDHLFQSDQSATSSMVDGGTVSLTDAQQANLTYGVSLPYQDSDTNIIARFDNAIAMIDAGWIATGDFTNPATADAWHHFSSTALDAARVGLGAITTCELADKACDASVGTLTSPLFTVTAAQSNLAMLISGGNAQMNNEVGIKVLDANNTELTRFNPGTCADAYVKNDAHWQTIDLSAYVGQSVKVQVFDNETSDCGFISVDHIHLTAKQPVDPNYVDFNLVSTDFVEMNPDQSVNSVTVSADAFTQVIGSFDSAIEMLSNGWVATGDFENPTNTADWQGTSRFTDAAKVGLAAVSTCELNNNAMGCDAPIGSLTSPAFKVDKARTYLTFLMSGGNGSAAVGLSVINPANQSVIAQYLPNSCADSRILGDQHWVSIDLSAWVGQFVQVSLFDEETGSCGFVSFDHLHMSSKRQIDSGIN